MPNKSSFQSLKKSSKSNMERLTQEITKISSTKQQEDDRFWKPDVDKSGAGYAIIRFLPACEGEDLPFVRLWTHAFKGPTGQWYIENSLTTIGQPDPVSEYNQKLWATESEANKNIARKQKRNLVYISNVYIVSDPKHPENEGQVKLYKYGKKIFDKINEAMTPQFSDEQPLNPFDLWTGANFKIKIRNVEGYRNYDKSEFDSTEPLFDDDSKLEEIWKSEYSLTEFVKPDQFKSYEQLQKQLAKVIGTGDRPVQVQTPWDIDKLNPKFGEQEAPSDKEQHAPELRSSDNSVDDEDDDLAYFQKLAES